MSALYLMLKECSRGESHFWEINAKLAEKNKFTTHFVQNCFIRNSQKLAKCSFKCVFGSARKKLGNCSDFSSFHDNSWLMAMVRPEASLSKKLLHVLYSNFDKVAIFRIGVFFSLKNNAINLSFKDFY